MQLICAFCKGKGKDPFGVPSKLSSCQVCAGKGKVHIKEPGEKCIPCRGTGVYAHHRLPCAVCGGKGTVSKLKGERCKGCKGTGLSHESSLPCSTCYGLGAVRISGAVKYKKGRRSI